MEKNKQTKKTSKIYPFQNGFINSSFKNGSLLILFHSIHENINFGWEKNHSLSKGKCSVSSALQLAYLSSVYDFPPL